MTRLSVLMMTNVSGERDLRSNNDGLHSLVRLHPRQSHSPSQCTREKLRSYYRWVA